MIRFISRAILFLLVLTTSAYLAAPAVAYIYAGKRKKINCGVLVVPGASQPLGPGTTDGQVGDLFFLLEQRIDLKPPGWSFDNPFAPGSPSAGLPKSNPDYWKVDLRTIRSLSRMHVLYLPASGTVRLDEQDREKLRQFVDSGGVLWIDNTAVGSSRLDFDDTFFITNFRFEIATGRDMPVSRHHPLLSLPFWLGDTEVAQIGSNWGQSVCVPGYEGTSWQGVDINTKVNFDVLYPVVINIPPTGTAMPSIAANHYGSGRIVATANFAGRGCYLNYPFNMPSLKFAYNVIAWASSWTHLRKDPRHSGNSIDTVGGTKLIEVWSLPVPPSTGGDCAPVIYKNVAFYSSGDKLYALDIMPQEDLDQDGNPDDGMPGLPPGINNKGQDIIWIWQGDSQLSSPSIVTAQDPFRPDRSFEAVLVMSSSGNVHMLQAFPTDPNTPWRLAAETTAILPPWYIGTASGNLSPPLYHNGWIFAVDGQGRLHAKNPSLQAWNDQNPGQTSVDTDWIVPDPGAYQGSSTFRCGPTFGFVKNETSGSVTGMMYWFGGPWSATGNAPTDLEQNDHVYGVPIYVCNDRLKVEQIDSSGTKAECRTSYRDAYISNIPKPVVQIQGLDVIQVEPNTRLASPAPGNDRGYIRITAAGQISPDAIVYATYALDYADRTGGIHWAPGTRMRVPLEPRSNAANSVPATQVAGMPALGSDGMIFLNGIRQSAGAGGSVYGIKNDGTTQYSRWIYHLHSGVNPADLQGVSGAGIPIPGVIVVDDPEDPNYGSVMANPQAFSSPAVAGDKVFVTVTGTGGYPSAALLCFKANSDFVIRIVENVGTDDQGRPVRRPKRLIDDSTGRQMQVKIWQPDLLQITTGNLLVTPLLSAVPVPREMIDYERGIISFDNFDRLKLRGGLNNMMMTNTFTPSLPVWVFLDNVEVPIDFNTWGPSKNAAQAMGLQIPAPTGTCVDLSGWNNLLWYYIVPPHSMAGGTKMPCSGIHSSPVVIGDTVYFTCDDGYVYAIPAETGVTSGRQIKSSSVIWNDRVSSSRTTAGVNTSPAGSNGVLLIPAGDGLHAYANMTTLVADGNRIVEVDGAGEASWSIEAITWPVGLPPNPNASPPVTSGPINKPARVRYVDKGDLLIVNSGANQVCKVDKSGTVGIARVKVELAGNAAPDGYIRWMWDRFTDPKKLLRPGQPTYLRAPTDALYWQEYDTDGNKHFLVTHCLVADSGNHRIVDLTYRVELDSNWSPKHLVARSPADPSTGFYLPELNWVTVTDSMNERYVYESLQLVPNVSNGMVAGHDIWAAVSNYRTGTMMDDNAPSRGLVRSQGLGGAIVALRYRLSGTGGWNYNDPNSGRIVAACDRIDWSGVRPLACPRYFQVIDRPPSLPTGNPERHLLICDNYGVYEAKIIPGGNTPPLVIKAFTDRDYRQNLRTLISEEDNTSLDDLGFLGIPLVANCVQELPNGRWLITNGYAGSDETAGRSFNGEIFEVDLSGSVPNITWCAPTLYTTLKAGGGGGLLPPGTWKQKMQKSYVFKQPRSAFRQL
jgi:hypothetical protein